MRTNIFRISTLLILLALSLTIVGPTPTTAAISSAQTTTGITLNATTMDGTPIAGAAVLVTPLKLCGQTDAAGRITFENLPITEQLDVTMTVEAAGYRPWMIRHAVVYPDDTLIVDAPLSVTDGTVTTPEVVDVPVHRTDSVEPQTMVDELDEVAPLVAGLFTYCCCLDACYVLCCCFRSQEVAMQCTRCGATHYRKNGPSHGVQR